MNTPEDGWHRLDPRMLALNLSVLAAPLAGFAATAIGTGGDIPSAAFWTIGSVGAVFLVMVAAGLIRYTTTRYRITDERVELRSGLLFRRYRSIPRDRIRSVDVTANPLHRIFGLTVVKVGTGQTGSATENTELALDAVTAAHGDQLRTQLLTKPDNTVTRDEPAEARRPTTADGERTDVTLAALNWSWLRFAPLTGWTLVVALILLAGAQRVLEAVGRNPFETGLVTDIVRWLHQFSLLLVIVAGAAVLLVVGVVGALVIYVEAWWNFRLVREPGGVFRVRRGLLTTRSVSLEERRLRGVEVIEPIAMRWAGGADTKAVATGFATSHKEQQRQKDRLLPPAPLTVSHRVTAAVLAEDETPVAVTELHAHPRRALRRRIVRAVVPPVALAALLLGLGQWLPWWLAPIALALLAVTIPLAFDAYRNLGHALTQRYLVTRYGTIFRRTVALRRTGVIGWTISRSYFQRRAGLMTVAATTGAGGGAYKVRDVAETAGLTFAEEAVPELLTPFVVRDTPHG
ncbi:MAG: PH domain-containing protein [Streptosporangiales bacterium]|nr:PH domain-containing protein [Streptosporangiales bacterium]